MKTLHRRCAGLDVHSDSVVACARVTVRTKVTHEVRRFSTTTQDLLELADWLAAQGITHVAMEATGIYWKPIWHILEGRFELVLANAGVRKRKKQDARLNALQLPSRPAGMVSGWRAGSGHAASRPTLSTHRA